MRDGYNLNLCSARNDAIVIFEHINLDRRGGCFRTRITFDILEMLSVNILIGDDSTEEYVT